MKQIPRTRAMARPPEVLPGVIVIQLGLITALGLVSFALAGCELLLDRDSLVVESFPGEPFQVVRADDRIWISFDRAMDHHTVETLFQIDSDRGSVSGTSRWHNQGLWFTPHRPLAAGTRYRMKLHGHVRDARGREHRVGVDLPFFAGSPDHLPPDVTTSDPASGSIIAPTDPISLQFSAPMDETVTGRNVSVQPAAEHTLTWQDGGTRLLIMPSSRWNTPSAMTLRVASDAADHDGSAMPRERRFLFFVQGITDRPVVTSVYALPMIDGREPVADAAGDDVNAPDAVIPVWSAIRIRFSQPMDRTTVERAWRLEPSIAGGFRWPDADTVVFVPSAPFEPDLTYRVTLSSQASDVDGNRIAGAFEQAFSPTDAGLTLSRLLVSGSPDPITEFPGAGSVALDPSAPPYFAMLFQFEFSHPFRSLAEKHAVVHALSMMRLLPGGQASPTAVQYGWITDRVLSVSYHGFHPPGSNEQGLFLLRIPGGPSGIQATGGHRLGTDVEVLFHMEGP
ncbi:MAG: hypothetical protein EA403_02175 [Spirochaetaceae bacterium]|nr:MAG: hypothetical protein EA403_02175 [Spirochaetaceae bacterium]